MAVVMTIHWESEGRQANSVAFASLKGAIAALDEMRENGQLSKIRFNVSFENFAVVSDELRQQIKEGY